MSWEQGYIEGRFDSGKCLNWREGPMSPGPLDISWERDLAGGRFPSEDLRCRAHTLQGEEEKQIV